MTTHKTEHGQTAAQLHRDLLHMLDCYGTRTAQWTAAAREALPTLLRSDPAVQRAWAEAKALDALLDTVPAADPGLLPATVAARILGGTGQTLLMAPRMLWRTALLMTLPALLGLATGLALPGPQTGTEFPTAEEWNMLAYGPHLNGEGAE